MKDTASQYCIHLSVRGCMMPRWICLMFLRIALISLAMAGFMSDAEPRRIEPRLGWVESSRSSIAAGEERQAGGRRS